MRAVEAEHPDLLAELGVGDGDEATARLYLQMWATAGGAAA